MAAGPDSTNGDDVSSGASGNTPSRVLAGRGGLFLQIGLERRNAGGQSTGLGRRQALGRQLPGVRQMTQAGLPVGRIALFRHAQPIVRLGVVDRIVDLIGNATIRRDVLGGQGPRP